MGEFSSHQCEHEMDCECIIVFPNLNPEPNLNNDPNHNPTPPEWSVICNC